jgi:hypothetical protein
MGEHATEILFLVEEAAEGGFTARAVGEDIFTEAMRPRPVRLQIVPDQIITV